MHPQVTGDGENMSVQNSEKGAHMLQRIGSFGTEEVDLPNLNRNVAIYHWLKTVVPKNLKIRINNYQFLLFSAKTKIRGRSCVITLLFFISLFPHNLLPFFNLPQFVN